MTKKSNKKQKDQNVKRTERGWIGHFCCADQCLFRRNTLLEYNEIKIVVSTVGLLKNYRFDENKNDKDISRFTTIGINRHFETMAFHASNDKRYYDLDSSRQINFDSPWAIAELDADDKANDMHEKVVEEITEKLLKGEKFETVSY